MKWGFRSKTVGKGLKMVIFKLLFLSYTRIFSPFWQEISSTCLLKIVITFVNLCTNKPFGNIVFQPLHV